MYIDVQPLIKKHLKFNYLGFNPDVFIRLNPDVFMRK